MSILWQGPVFELLLDGGSCVEDLSSGIITCTQPSVTLTKTPGACNLKYTSPTVVQVLSHFSPATHPTIILLCNMCRRGFWGLLVCWWCEVYLEDRQCEQAWQLTW